jgi:membrane associated rhomboid family serine protease
MMHSRHMRPTNGGGGHYGSPLGFQAGVTPAVRALLIANVVVFIIQQAARTLEPKYGAYWFDMALGLVPEQVVRNLCIWQPFTYMFLHGGVLHLLFNMLVVWMFGCDVERHWGTRRFMRFYILSGLAAALCTMLVAILSSKIAGNPTIGASGAVLGVLVGYAMLFPNNRITLLLAFVIPVTMKARTMAMGCALLTILHILATPIGEGGTAHFAHLGGLVFGFLYVKFGDGFEMMWRRRRGRRAERRLHARSENRESYDRFMKEEVDPILDKISRDGVDSLTRDEKATLRRAQKMQRG